MAPFGLLKIAHLDPKAWINPCYAVFLRKRAKEKQEVSYRFRADSAAYPPSVNETILPILYGIRWDVGAKGNNS